MSDQRFRAGRCWGILAIAVAVAACASTPPASDPVARAAYEEANDPLEPFNRAMFSVDMALNAAFIRPVAWTYREVVPEPARRGVTNFLRNLRSPITFANNLLQGDLDRAGVTVGRFALNTTGGLLGFVDVAESAGLPYHYEDFGQTLAVWGATNDTYLYVPIFGPTGVRDGLGLAVDNFAFDAVSWYSYADNPGWVQWAYFGTLLIDIKAGTMQATDELEKSSIDYYAALRSAWRQNRDSQIRNGAPAPLPDMDNGDAPDPFAARGTDAVAGAQ
ncbi:MAG: VacJ family lipoprotein [Rhodospirillaceae bacterium]|nr:VacJ family lipoprotein [Rhodospirillaceae bacterium]